MERGVIYIGHLPHGFYEKELKEYFSQFGKVTRLRVCRSKKTGGCKGYGFIEFECNEVAKIAAETMNNYLMYEKLLKCHVVPSDKVSKDLFKNYGNYQTLSYMRQRKLHNSQKTPELDQKRKEKGMRKLGKTKQKLAAMGIQYNFEIGKSQKRVSFTEDLTEKDSDKMKPVEKHSKIATFISNSLPASSITASVADNNNIAVDKTPKRSPKDRSCKRKQNSLAAKCEQKDQVLISTPKYKILKPKKATAFSTSKKTKIQTLSIQKRSPKERKCKLNRRISLL